MGLGKNIKTILDSIQRTVPWLAQQTGIPTQTIYSMIRNNSKSTDDNTLEKLSVALKVPPAFLTSEDFTKIPSNVAFDDTLSYIQKQFMHPDFDRILFNTVANCADLSVIYDDLFHEAIINTASNIPDNPIKNALLEGLTNTSDLEEDFILTKLISYYYQFNLDGKRAMLQRVKELSFVPDYIAKKKDSCNNNQDK
ncbi:unknown [Clostridium sp. CAG:505]|nr:unknown [Clostridium sp. CAG:505]